MHMFDDRLGKLEVEIQVGFPEIEDSYIFAGYSLENFKELTEEELDYLNEEYPKEIVSQAIMILTSEKTPKEELH